MNIQILLIFFKKNLSTELFKYFNINKYIINLELDKQPPYKWIYNLLSITLKIFNIYIKTNLANNFI